MKLIKLLRCTAIDLLSVEAAYVNFGSARVSVREFSFPGLTECTRDVLYQTVPNVFGVASPPGPAVRSGATLTVPNLDFCTTNYSFLLTPVSIHNVNGSTISTNVISGDREGERNVTCTYYSSLKLMCLGFQISYSLYRCQGQVAFFKGSSYMYSTWRCLYMIH